MQNGQENKNCSNKRSERIVRYAQHPQNHNSNEIKIEGQQHKKRNTQNFNH
jgi:hypothetical protein